MLSTNPRVEGREHDGSAPGDLFAGRYRARSEIGHGSTGKLFLAQDLQSGEQVVVKRAADAALLRHEADVLDALAHPDRPADVVGLKERHDAASPPFLLLEPIEGADLEAFLARHGGTLDEAALGRLLIRLADTAATVHARGYLHRDLKPGNVLIRADGSPVIVDFGAALPLNQAGDGSQWSFVTDGYAAPEQYFADGREGPWTDVYGLGAIGHRALAGKPPAAALIRAGGARGEPLAGDRGPARALREAIDWALEPDAADRPQAMAAWRERLAAALQALDRQGAQPGAAAGPALDDYPPTVRVPRARTGHPRPPAAAVREVVPAAPRRARLVPVVLILAVLAAAAGAAGWYGAPLYERYVKTEWLVDQGGAGDAVTISDALARAGDGAIIRIGPGTYRESLHIERPASLIALEGATSVVAPESGPCALVTARSGTIAGLELHGAAAPEGSAGGGGEAPEPCLTLAAGTITVEGNRIVGGAGPAMLIRDGADPVVRGNRLEGAGLVVTAGGRGTITENAIADAGGPGLVVRAGADPSLSDNVIEGGQGVVFAEGAAGSLIGNRVLGAGATAIRVTTGADPRIVDNTIENAKEAGIFVYDGGIGRYEGNTITGSGLSGVAIAGTGRPTFVGNTIRESAEHGILVVEGGRAVLQSNQIVGNKGHGIALAVGSEVELTDNRLDGNGEPQLLDAR